MRRWLWLWLLGCGGLPVAAPAAEPDAPALSARFMVSTSTHPAPQAWIFWREARRVAWLKGPIDEVWHRDAQGRLHFERVFHAERQVVDYSAGELAALGVQADWADLSRLVSARERATLKPVGHSGAGAMRTLHLQGGTPASRLRIDWLPALQLPALIERRERAGTTRIRLVEHSATAPAQWPRPGQRAADYLHLDAADAGDMGHDAAMRKSQTLDQRAGWRLAPGLTGH
jgi:hypothetical protein